MYLCTGSVVTHPDQPPQEENMQRVAELHTDICNFNQTVCKCYREFGICHFLDWIKQSNNNLTNRSWIDNQTTSDKHW